MDIRRVPLCIGPAFLIGPAEVKIRMDLIQAGVGKLIEKQAEDLHAMRIAAMPFTFAQFGIAHRGTTDTTFSAFCV